MTSPMATPRETLPPLPPVVTEVVVPARRPKIPGLALVLSLFPGVGQLYNGHIQKAFAFFATFAGSIYMAGEADVWLFGMFVPFVVFYAIIDAYRSATIINARAAGRPPEPEPEDEDVDSPAWGVILLSMGVVLLLNNLGVLRIVAVQRFWPLLLVIAGIVFLRRSLQRAEARRAGAVSTGGDHGPIA